MKCILISVAMQFLFTGCATINEELYTNTGAAVQRTVALETQDTNTTRTTKEPQRIETINPKSNVEIELCKETEHFYIYSSKNDNRLAEVLTKALETGYQRVSEDLACTLQDKTVVRIYPDIKSFHIAIGKPDAPSWYIGEGYGGVISITADMTNYSPSNVIIHELTHIMTSENYGSLPQWLFQGIAKYEGKETPDANIESAVRSGVSNEKIPLLKELDTDYETFVDMGGYEYSYVAVHYILAEYGHDKLIKFLRSPYNYQGIFGISEDEFNNRWLSYVQEKYR